MSASSQNDARRSRPIRVWAVCAALVSAASTCSSCSSSSGGGQQSPAPLLPPSIRDRGVLVVATDPNYAPNEFQQTPGAAPIGMDVDIATALGTRLGLKTQVQIVSFDSIVPGVVDGTYTIGISSISDTKQRQQAVEFVTYYTAGTSLLALSGNPMALAPDDQSLCGHTVAVETGTVQQTTDIPQRSAACLADGRPAVRAVQFADQNSANAAVTGGKADAALADSPVAAYAVSLSEGKLTLVGSPYDTSDYGIAIARDQPELASALLLAVKQMVDDGTYQQILTKWGVQLGALTDPWIDTATS